VDAQENPLTTIEAKKFFEVQKYIILTGHITDHVNTTIAGRRWAKLSDQDKKIFTEVTQEAAARATRIVQEREAALVQAFKDRGLNVEEVDKAAFEQVVRAKVPLEDFGYKQADYDRIRAVQ
jgi:TRAP-type C4-dicarboxylate transport system substrate-binding protein